MSSSLSSARRIGYSGRCFLNAVASMRKPFIFLLLALSLWSATAWAEPDWYRVEIVIFANAERDAGEAEAWPTPDAPPDFNNARQLAPAGSNEPYTRLADGELKLDGVVQALRSSGVRRPLLHTGWKQPMYERGKAQPVWIASGPSLHLADGRSIQEIAGTLLLTRSRFLHVWTDLRYAEQGFPVSTYVMEDHRRMRSGELHYVDHPMFGLLILCTPM